MARSEEYTRQQVIEAAYKAKGKTTLIAQVLGCSPETVRNYAKRYATVSNAIDEARLDFRDGLADKAEIKLEQAVVNGESWAIQYALKTQAKDRGYVERQEVRNLNIDINKLSDDELERIAGGEDPISVLDAKSQG